MDLVARVVRDFRIPKTAVKFALADRVIPKGITGLVLYEGPAYRKEGITDGTRSVVMSVGAQIGTAKIPNVEILTIPRSHVVIQRPRRLDQQRAQQNASATIHE